MCESDDGSGQVVGDGMLETTKPRKQGDLRGQDGTTRINDGEQGGPYPKAARPLVRAGTKRSEPTGASRARPPRRSQSVRSSVEAGQCPWSQGTQEDGSERTRVMEEQPASVPAAQHAGAARPFGNWAKPWVWTRRMLATLKEGIKGGKWFRPNAFFAKHGLYCLTAAHAQVCQSSRR